MNQKRVLQGLLVLWGLWNIFNGVFSTFAPQAVAGMVGGWVPASGWTTELVAMSQQYGMVLLLLGGVYLLTATDPVRYRAFILIIVAEQIIGIAYSAYSTFGLGQANASQFITQALINIVVAAVFLVLRSGAAPTTGRASMVSA